MMKLNEAEAVAPFLWKTGRTVLTLLFVGILTVGCSQITTTSTDNAHSKKSVASKDTQSSSQSASQKEGDSKPSEREVNAGSKFSKVSEGMSYYRVTNTIGEPTDIHSYKTGKSWIPYYHGSDRRRKEAYYKNEGRLVFNARNTLIKIIVDKSEDGYR